MGGFLRFSGSKNEDRGFFEDGGLFFEDGGVLRRISYLRRTFFIFDLQSRRSKNPLSPIFGAEDRITPNLQSSIFGPENRRTPHLRSSARKNGSKIGRKTRGGRRGCDFFEDGERDSSKMGRLFDFPGPKNEPLPSSTFSARRTKNPSILHLLDLKNRRTPSTFFFFRPLPSRPMTTSSFQLF